MNTSEAAAARNYQTTRMVLLRTGRHILMHWRLYVLLLPAFVYVLIFSYFPMYGIQIAFKNFRNSLGITGSPWVGMKYFEKFFSLPIFWKLLSNTLSITILSLFTFPLPIIFSLMLNEIRSPRLKKSVQMVSYAPHFISTVVLCSMITLFLDNSNGGILARLFTFFTGESVNYLTISSAFPSIVVWSDVWQNLGWNSIIYLSALAGVSHEIVEAARIDGANRLQIVWHVNIPSILPTIMVLLIMRCGSLLNLGYEKIFLLQNPLNLDASRVISTYVYEIGIEGNQFSLSTAIGLFNNVINVAILALINFVSQKTTENGLW